MCENVHFLRISHHIHNHFNSNFPSFLSLSLYRSLFLSLSLAFYVHFQHFVLIANFINRTREQFSFHFSIYYMRKYRNIEIHLHFVWNVFVYVGSRYIRSITVSSVIVSSMNVTYYMRKENNKFSCTHTIYYVCAKKRKKKQIMKNNERK